MTVTRAALTARILGAAIVATTCAGVVAVAAEPTGASSPQGVVPSSSRLAADVPIDGVHVLLVSDSQDQLGVLVAYRGRKGWLAARPEAAPPAVRAAWTSTPGGGPVPALSMAFGSTTAPRVSIRWADGEIDTTRTQPDGSWLAVRTGDQTIRQVRLIAASGRVVGTVSAL